MPTIVNLDFGEVDIIFESEMEKVGEKAQEKVKERTPEDTGELVDHIELGEVEKTLTGYSIEVYTDLDEVEYAGIVEDGVDGKEYQYNKPKGTPLGGKRTGAKMYHETAEEIAKSYSSIT